MSYGHLPCVYGDFVMHEKGQTRWRAPLPPKIPGTPRREHRPTGRVDGDWIVAGMTATRWRGRKARWRWVEKEGTYALAHLTKVLRLGDARIVVLSTPVSAPAPKPAEIVVTLALAGGAR